MMDYSKIFRFIHAKEKRVERDIELVRLGKKRKEEGEKVDLSFNLVL